MDLDEDDLLNMNIFKVRCPYCGIEKEEYSVVDVEEICPDCEILYSNRCVECNKLLDDYKEYCEECIQAEYNIEEIDYP